MSERPFIGQDMPGNCLLSIIIPFFNAETTIRRTMESLSNVSTGAGERVEVIMVDDGSDDGGSRVASAMKQELPHLSITLMTQQNAGTSAARNAGLMRARGEWVFFLDADDELAFDPVPFIEKHTDASCLAFAVRYYLGSEPRGISRPVSVNRENHLAVFTSRNAVAVSGVIFRKDRMDNYFDPQYRFLEDWLFWIQNHRIFEVMKVFPDVSSAVIHSHGANKTADREKHGKFRRLVAEKVLSDFGPRLAPQQKNNLLIQSRIGMVQEGLKVPADTFFLFPCNALLYLKMLAYVLFGKRLASLDLYGS